MSEKTLAGMYEVDNPDCPKVIVGEFTILKQSESRIWIQCGGEGADFTNELFAEFLKEFFDKHF